MSYWSNSTDDANPAPAQEQPCCCGRREYEAARSAALAARVLLWALVGLAWAAWAAWLVALALAI